MKLDSALRAKLAKALAALQALKPAGAPRPATVRAYATVRATVAAVALGGRAHRRSPEEPAQSPSPRSSRTRWYRRARRLVPSLPPWDVLRKACARWPELRTIVTPPPGGAAARAGGPRRKGNPRSPHTLTPFALAYGPAKRRRKSSKPVEYADETLPFDHPRYTAEYWEE